MKRILLILTLCASTLRAQDALTVTLPTGKTITFQTAEQKAKYEAKIAETRQTRAAAEEKDRIETAKRSLEARNAEADAKTAQADMDRKSRMRWLKIVQITEDGILAMYQGAPAGVGGLDGYGYPDPAMYKYGIIFVECKPRPTWIDGYEFRAKIYDDGVYSYTTTSGASARIGMYQINGGVMPIRD